MSSHKGGGGILYNVVYRVSEVCGTIAEQNWAVCRRHVADARLLCESADMWTERPRGAKSWVQNVQGYTGSGLLYIQTLSLMKIYLFRSKREDIRI